MTEPAEQIQSSEIRLRTHWFALLWLALFAALATTSYNAFRHWWDARFTVDLTGPESDSIGTLVRLTVFDLPVWFLEYLRAMLVLAVGIYGAFVVLRTILGAPMRKWIDL